MNGGYFKTLRRKKWKFIHKMGFNVFKINRICFLLSTFNLYPLFWVTVKCPLTMGSTHTLKLSFQMWVYCVSSPCRFYWSNIIWRSSCHLHVNRREQFFVCFISIFNSFFFNVRLSVPLAEGTPPYQKPSPCLTCHKLHTRSESWALWPLVCLPAGFLGSLHQCLGPLPHPLLASHESAGAR